MKTFAAALFAAGVSAISELEMKYVQYLADFGKTLSTHTEFNLRMDHFARSIKEIEEHNATDSTFKKGLTHLSDWSENEYRQLLGLRREPHPVGTQYISYPEVENYNSIDWIAKGAVTAVKDQGQCGSCWSFSATGTMEGEHFVRTGKLLSFSEQQLVSCSTANYGCNGGWQYKAFKYYESHDAITEANYPYTSGRGQVASCQYSSKTKTSVEASNYGFVTADSISDMYSALTKQPLAVSVEADRSAWQNYSSGVLSGTACGTNLDHAVLVVGYGTENGVNYWHVKNSWGTSWGERGYIKLAVVSGKGTCGVQMEPETVASN